MRFERSKCLLALVVLTLGAMSMEPVLAEALDVPAASVKASEQAADRHRALRWVPVAGPLPEALAYPEGQTRWDFTSVALGEPAADLATYADVSGDGAAERWQRPHKDAAFLDAAAMTRLGLQVREGKTARELLVELRRVGQGWVDLPAGPREAVLQRALVYEAVHDGRGFRPAYQLHRWVDPRSGLLAEVRVAVDDRGRPAGEATGRVAYRPDKGGGLKIYADQIDVPILSHVAYGFDRGSVAVSTLTPEGHATIGDLAAAGSWDFSSTNLVNSEAEIASTRTVVSQDETCNFDKCGFSRPGATLAREDKNFDAAEGLNVTLSVQERENRANDVTIWLRAGVTNEGEAGAAVGDGESRLCFVGDERTEVPLFRFANEDADGFFFQNGDAWAHTPFACELDIFALSVCPDACGSFCPNRTFACGDHPGVQSNQVIGEGPVTLPSGHTFNALLIKNVADFCVSPFDGCPSLFAQDVRTVVYLWVVPHLGTVARLMSGVSEADDNSFTVLAETDIKFGLFPPRSISATGAGETTLDIAWDPGQVTHRIDGYRIYWDTDSGVNSGYAFDSFNNAAQVVIDGTMATISGLTPGTEYFVTVTAVSDYVNPRTGVQTTYESLLYPTTVAASPAAVPAEVVASTEGGACTPTAEVSGVTANRIGDQVELCWDVAEDPCLEGYSILGAATPESDLGFSVLVPDTGLVTCQLVDTTSAYLLAVTSGSGETGPWGHYDR